MYLCAEKQEDIVMSNDKKSVYVIWNPPSELESYYGKVVWLGIADGNFCFLLMMPDGTFKQARAEHCRLVDQFYNVQN